MQWLVLAMVLAVPMGASAQGPPASPSAEAGGETAPDEPTTGPTPAGAEEPGEESSLPPGTDPEAEARRLFEEANRALREDRVEEGIALLERSLSLGPNLATQFNLAIALRRAGRVQAAIDRLEAIGREDHGALVEAQRAEVELQLQEARSALATLTIRAPGVPSATIRIDEALAGVVAAGALSVAVDPGSHVVELRAPGHEPEVQTVVLEAGERRELAVHLRALPGDVASPTPIAPPGPSEVRSPPEGEGVPAWLWIAGGVVLAGIAAAVAIVLMGSPDPVTDPVTGRWDALSF